MSLMTEREIRADERSRLAKIMADAADMPDSDPERALILREIASVLRTPEEELLLRGLTAIADELREGIGVCTKCGTREHLHLLDGKSSSGDENDDFERIECIACYGPGWGPTAGEEDFALSIVPRFKPLYEAWAQQNRNPPELSIISGPPE